MRSLFRKTLEATGNSTLHFSCQTPAGLMACSQRAARQRDGVAGPRRGRSADQRQRPSARRRQLPYIPLRSRPPERLKLLNVLRRQINLSHLSGSRYVAGLAFKEENEIWSQLYSNCREAQMFLLFLPFHILLNLPSLLPSLPMPSIWQAAARKPVCIHNSSPARQLIIRPAITHLPPHLQLMWNTVELFLFHFF